MLRRVSIILGLFAFLLPMLAGSPVALMAPSDCAEQSSVSGIAAGNSRFAFDLYKKIASDEANTSQNIFFSPYSISTALGMTYAGARGDTEKQMASVLNFSMDRDYQHRSFQTLAALVDGAGKKYQLSVGNALWGQISYPFDKEFLALIAQYYKGGFNLVDFASETEQSRQRINQWVEDKTADKIKELLQPGDISALTRLVLTNAIYFKGDWETKFDLKRTHSAPFMVFEGNTRDVQTMSQSGSFSYTETKLLQAIELPYIGDEMSMLILLPKGEMGTMEEQLSLQMINELQGQMQITPLSLYLPRFKFNARYGLHDKKYLPDMGMVDAFDEKLADFSGMTGKKNLVISGVFHKAFIEVNESGSEAAAATAVVVGLKSMPLSLVEFRADHPFIFMILHKATRSILFMGRVSNPVQ